MLTFRDYMFEALYGDSGYYSQGRVRFGARGDFFTASQIHELFGQVLASEFVRQWLSESSPSRFTILELGPGTGEFAFDALSYIRDTNPAFYDSLSYICCEISSPLIEIQRERLHEFEGKVTWFDDIDDLPPFERGVIFSNEFFDALPVHVIRQSGRQLQELFVAHGEWMEGEISDDRLLSFWKRAGVPLVEGQRVEICLDAIKVLEKLALKCSRTLMITIDYGEIADKLYTIDRPLGTLRCFRQHVIGDDPFSEPGQWDMTASVNFSSLIAYGKDFGFTPQKLISLARYLSSLGLLERAAELSARANRTPRDMQRILQSKQLIVEQGFAASFNVLVTYKL